MPLDTIMREHAIEWRTTRRREVAAGTVNRELALLKHLMGTAVPKYIAENPVARLSDLRTQNRDIRTLSREEETRLLAAASDQERALIICGLDTLQRLSNVAGLKRT